MNALSRWRLRRRRAAIRRIEAEARAPQDAPGVTLIGDGIQDLPEGVSAAPSLSEAHGDFVAWRHAGDRWTAEGLTLIRAALSRAPEAQMLFTDEMTADGELILKPGFDPVLLAGLDYVSHSVLFRRSRLMDLPHGEDPKALVQAFAAGLRAEQILHLPWPALIRSGPPPFAIGQTAETPKQTPKVSVIIPNRDSPALIRQVLTGVLKGTDYPDLEVIVVDNGSTDPATLAVYEAHRADPRFRVEIRPAPFNFSAMVNRGVALAMGDRVLLLNNDIEVEGPHWLSEMCACLERPGTGIVGARLLFPDRRIQHAGVVAGHRGRAGHWFYKAPEDAPGPMGMLRIRRSVSVVTGAAMLIARACLEDAGPWNEQDFAVAYNDVDFCLRARARGWGVTYTPHATLVHHESLSRRKDRAARARFTSELAALKRLHGTETFQDPAQSPWWSRRHSRPQAAVPDSVPQTSFFMGGGDDAGKARPKRSSPAGPTGAL